MNRKRNVNYIKPEDPQFLKVLKKQAGYDDRNHKFDVLDCSENDFVEDGDDEQPQVVVLKKGHLTAEQAEVEKRKIEQNESDTKADLSQPVIFKSKSKDDSASKKRKHEDNTCKKPLKSSKMQNMLSFTDYEEEENDSS